MAIPEKLLAFKQKRTRVLQMKQDVQTKREQYTKSLADLRLAEHELEQATADLEAEES